MAVVRCRSCSETRPAGCLPVGGCAGIALLAVALAGIAAWQAAKYGQARGTWLTLVLPVPAFLVTLLVVVLVLGHLAMLVDWIQSRGMRCPSCGSRSWSYPFVERGSRATGPGKGESGRPPPGTPRPPARPGTG
jgi:hypothetical protein